MASVEELATNIGVSLRNEQKICLEHLINGKSVYLSLSTGCGKTICFQLFSLAIQYSGFVLVLAPLTVILLQQKESCEKLGVRLMIKKYSNNTANTTVHFQSRSSRIIFLDFMPIYRRETKMPTVSRLNLDWN